MPEFNGFEVVKALKSRAETREIPVIAVTAMPKGCQEMQMAGADACLMKPFGVEEFVDLVRRYLPMEMTQGNSR
jgi:CheY-like chemotaxis protein